MAGGARACTGSRCRCRRTGSGGQRLRPGDRRRAHADRRRAGRSRCPATSSSVAASEHRPAASDIRRFLVTHVHRDHYTQAVTIRREVGSHVSLGIGDKPTLDVIHERDRAGTRPAHHAAERAGAHDIARAWGEFTRRHDPDLSLWGYPDTWLEGDDHPIEVGDRALDAVADARPHPGPLRLRRPGRRAALRGRPRAADDHPVDRLRAGGRGRAARRLHGVADQGPRPARPARCCPPTARWRRPRTPASTSCWSTTSIGSRCAVDAVGTGACRRTTSPGCCRGPGTSATLQRPRRLQRRARHAGDAGPPRAAGRARRGPSAHADGSTCALSR